MCNLNAKHPHDETIRAYLDGKTIQFKKGNGEWIDVSPFTANAGFHSFWKNTEYRLKPPEPVKKYKWAYKDKQGTVRLSEGFYSEAEWATMGWEICTRIEYGYVVELP